jgi:hypothetical protein
MILVCNSLFSLFIWIPTYILTIIKLQFPAYPLRMLYQITHRMQILQKGKIWERRGIARSATTRSASAGVRLFHPRARAAASTLRYCRSRWRAENIPPTPDAPTSTFELARSTKPRRGISVDRSVPMLSEGGIIFSAPLLVVIDSFSRVTELFPLPFADACRVASSLCWLLPELPNRFSHMRQFKKLL